MKLSTTLIEPITAVAAVERFGLVSDRAESRVAASRGIDETLSPSGRVIQRRVVDNATGAVLEDVLLGYAGDGHSPAYAMANGSTAVTTYAAGPGGPRRDEKEVQGPAQVSM